MPCEPCSLRLASLFSCSSIASLLLLAFRDAELGNAAKAKTLPHDKWNRQLGIAGLVVGTLATGTQPLLFLLAARKAFYAKEEGVCPR